MRFETGIGGETRHAEHAESRSEWGYGRVKLPQGFAGRGRMRAPAGRRQHDIADGITGLAGCDHLAHAFTGHHLADTDRFRVRFAIIHAPAHVGIEREVEHT